MADANEAGDEISIFKKSTLEISMMYMYFIEVPKKINEYWSLELG